MDFLALGQQVGGGLVVGFGNHREELAGGAGGGFLGGNQVPDHVVGLGDALDFLDRSTGRGTDAQATVTVRIGHNGKMSVGRGTNEDILVASAMAFINALNRLEKMREENEECPTL